MPIADLNFNSKKLLNIANATSANDAAAYGQLKELAKLNIGSAFASTDGKLELSLGNGIQITDNKITLKLNGDSLLLSDAGIALSQSAFTTGDVKITLKNVADSGWVIMNDGNIGDASSSATTRANADTQNLFTLGS